jgi:O-antigen/teichoic acid export membrane protein
MRIPGLKLISSFSIYAIAIFFNAGLSFIVFSWLTHRLTPDDFGIINLYSSYTILLVPFISCGAQFILSVDYFKISKEKYGSHFINGISIPFFMWIILSVGSIIFLDFLKSSLKVNTFFILVAPFTCLLMVYNDIIIAQIRNRGRHTLFARYFFFKTIVEGIFTVVLVTTILKNWEGRLGGALAAFVCCFFLMYYLVRTWQLDKGKFEIKDTLSIARQGLPFIPERIAVFFLSYSDRFFIDYFKGTYNVGIYSAGAQVGIIVNLITIALNYSFQPVIFRHLSVEAINYKSLRTVLLSYMGVALVFTAGIIIAIPFIFRYIIGSAFRESGIFAINLTIAGFLWAVYNNFLSCFLLR